MTTIDTSSAVFKDTIMAHINALSLEIDPPVNSDAA